MAAVDRGSVQPIQSQADIPYLNIIGEVQLAQRILRRVDFLRGCTFQQFSCFYRVQYQQPTVTVRRADDVLCVCIFCIC